MKRRVTLKDVADAVGVHLSTVSRALDPSTPHRVSDELAEKIERASRRLGYKRNSAAYTLKKNTTRTIGVIIPDITDPAFPPIIRGIEDALARRGYVAIVTNTDGDARRESEMIDMLRDRGVDGLLLASVEIDDPVAGNEGRDTPPIVTVNRQIIGSGLPCVVADEAAGMQAVVTHLVALGHRRIAAIAGPQHLSTGVLRHRGFLAACDALGLGGDPPVAIARFYREEEGERCTETLLATSDAFTALVCANDRLAIGAIAALRRRGLECPSDVAVTGFNDMIMVDRLTPPLTTVRVPKHQMGVRAAEMIVDLIEGRPEGSRNVTLPVDLVVRGSTGRARAEVSVK
jgi:LacI family transcriptional regulator